MATMSFNRYDFCKLVGKDFTIKELEDKLPMLGLSWEGVDGDEIEVEIFPNRPDMLSVEGLARAFSSFTETDTGIPEYPVIESDYKVHVDAAVMNIRPYIACAVIKGAKLDDETIRSMLQLQEKLHATHCRRRAKASIGVYDLAKITFPLRYTTTNEDFKFTPLGWETPHSVTTILNKHPRGVEYGWILKSSECYPILIDSKDGVLSMPPIINSHGTAITLKTKDLFIDVTGTDPKTVKEVLNIVTTALSDRGGEIHSVIIEYPRLVEDTPDLSPQIVKLDLKYVNNLLGVKLGLEDVIKLLEQMRFDAVEFTGAKQTIVEVTVPAYRTDIMHPIDLVEDIAIAYGYQNFKPELPPLFTVGQESENEQFSRKVISLMTGLDFQEALTYILSNKTKLFTKMNVKEQEIVQTVNPRTAEFTSVRSWLLPSLIEALTFNQHNLFPQKLVEAGDCLIFDSKSDTGTQTLRKLAGVVCHDTANLTECKSIIESMLNNLGVKYEIKETEHPSFISSRVGDIIINGKPAGFFGEIHPSVLANWKLEKPVIAFEIDLAALH